LHNNKEMAEFFDRLAPSWLADENENGIRDEIVEMAGIMTGAVIADIGSGRGVMVPHLLKTNPSRLLENDISSEMIRFAKEMWTDERLEFFCGDILQIEIPLCDTIVLFNALPHFVHRKELAQKLASCLEQNGTVILAHSKSRNNINGIHKEGIAEILSSKLLPPLEEYENFKQHFRLVNSVDSSRMYFIKMLKK
jgi:2-polyprenyl-3-methyl-5-hydroxy-6-metoxy-1,4-benzoquinol methylase